MSKKSEGFVFVAADGRFMAMVKHSAKTRLPSQLVTEFFTVMTHSTRKTFAFDICRHDPNIDKVDKPNTHLHLTFDGPM
jgi:hypothetical protein